MIFILDFENNANPFIERRIEIKKWKEMADSFVNETEKILITMNELKAIGLKPLDALHVLCAVSLQCQYLLTVDKGILKKITEYSEIKITNPVNFIIEWETMRTDTEIKMAGFEILSHNLGIVETERFIALIKREKFDYTRWRENLFYGLSGKEISKRAMEFQNTLKNE